MTALRTEAFVDRLPDEVEIRNAEQLRTIVASQMKGGEPTTLSLASEGGEVQNVTLAPALAASLLEVLRLVCFKQAWSNSIDSNSMRCQGNTQSLDHHLDGSFGSIVRRVVRFGQSTID